MKPFYRTKGKYKDGRRRIVIEWTEPNRDVKSKALPKPEKLLSILDRQIWTKKTKKKQEETSH